jgi:hypothetical protein
MIRRLTVRRNDLHDGVRPERRHGGVWARLASAKSFSSLLRRSFISFFEPKGFHKYRIVYQISGCDIIGTQLELQRC